MRDRVVIRWQMNEPSPPPEAASKPAPERHQGHGLAYTVIAVFLLALVFGVWGLWKVFTPAPGDASAQLEEQSGRIAAVEHSVANFPRSDQISRNANTALQGTLAERDEEIAGLRADVACYERFVGATGQRRGLTVHELSLKPQAAQAWHFVATLTQNLNRGAINQGRATLSVEGTREGRMQQLDWNSLRQQPEAPGLGYSFKYFQQVEGDILLPPGLKPVRVIVRVAPERGEAVERSFTWADATASQAPGAR